MKAKHITEAVMHAVFFSCGMLAIAFVALITPLYRDRRPARHRRDRLERIFCWARVEVHRRRAEIRHSALYPYQLLGNPGRGDHRRAGGGAHRGIPFQGGGTALAGMVRPAVELLAGIPSVVYGLVGMMVLVPRDG